MRIIEDHCNMPEGRFSPRRFLLSYQGHLDKQPLHDWMKANIGPNAKLFIGHVIDPVDNEVTMCAVECKDQYDCKNHEYLDYKGKHPKIGIPKTTKKDYWGKVLELINGHDSDILGDLQHSTLHQTRRFVKQCKTWGEVMENDEHCEAIYKKRGYYKDLYNACLVRQSVTVPQYRPHQFKRSLDTSKPVLICGDPGTGKTQFAIAQFKSPLVVSSSEEQDDPKASPLDILLKFDPNLHDAIVFDDLSFANRPFEFLKVLLDMDLDGPIRCSYNRTAIIPAGTPRVFTHNEKTIFDPSSKATEKQRCAIKRRYSVMEVSSPLFQLEAVSFIAPDGQDQR